MVPRDAATETATDVAAEPAAQTPADELTGTAWYRRHHVGLKEGYVREGVHNEATTPHFGLEDELDLILAEYTSPEEVAALMDIARRHPSQCIAEVVREAVRTEVDRQADELDRVRTASAPRWFHSSLAASPREPLWFASPLGEP